MSGLQFLKLENVAGHLESAVKFAAGEYARELRFGIQMDLEHDEPSVESPIEAIFKIWWDAVAKVQLGQAWDAIDLRSQRWAEVNGRRYRLDFLILPSDTDSLYEAETQFGVRCQVVGIELDGHEFHERTKEQVALRNQRDRDLQRAGYLMFHFSGSEVHREPMRCVSEAMKAGLDCLNAFKFAYSRARRTPAQLSAEDAVITEALDGVGPTGRSGQ